MSKADETVQEPIVARVVHRSVVMENAAGRRVIKLMFNLLPQNRRFEAGSNIGFQAPAAGDAQLLDPEPLLGGDLRGQHVVSGRQERCYPPAQTASLLVIELQTAVEPDIRPSGRDSLAPRTV